MQLEKCLPIKQRDWKNWRAKNEKLNADIVLKIGMKVRDCFGTVGIIQRIEEGYDIEEHGTIEVFRLDTTDYGLNNCEHFCFYDWQKHLRILDMNE
jgi:hypothetical protein